MIVETDSTTQTRLVMCNNRDKLENLRLGFLRCRHVLLENCTSRAFSCTSLVWEGNFNTSANHAGNGLGPGALVRSVLEDNTRSPDVLSCTFDVCPCEDLCGVGQQN